MNWKDVFNTGLKHWYYLDAARTAAENSGYKFFVWNGWVYTTDLLKTDIKEEDLT